MKRKQVHNGLIAYHVPGIHIYGSQMAKAQGTCSFSFLNSSLLSAIYFRRNYIIYCWRNEVSRMQYSLCKIVSGVSLSLHCKIISSPNLIHCWKTLKADHQGKNLFRFFQNATNCTVNRGYPRAKLS